MVNEVLDQFKEYNDEWENLTKSILEKRTDTMKLCDGMDKYKNANIKHVVLGCCLAALVNGLTVDELKE